jgi:PAS domain S-box-containing protein
MTTQWEEMAAQLDAMAQVSTEAEALIESLASAIFPAHARGVANLTWSERSERSERLERSERSEPLELSRAPRTSTGLSVEERLRAAELRLRALVEQIPAVTFMAVLGEGTNEVYVSPHIEQLLGYSQEEWLADPFLWYRRLHMPDRELWNNEFARGCRNGGPFRAECRFVARDGHLVWVHGEARIVKDDRGRPMFLQGVAFDISESKRAQDVLLDEAVRTAKAEEQFEMARRVQTSILPRRFEVPGLDIAAAMIPANEVGGDYYDVLPTADGAWIAIGDVSGHGLDSGLVMLMVQSATRAMTLADPDGPPRNILCLVNEVLYDNIRVRLQKDDYVTFTLMRYTRDGRFVFAGAHEDILVWRAATQQVERIRPPGTWLGARRDIRQATVDSLIELGDDDLMLLYTDGVTEAKDSRRRQFDIGRLCSVLQRVGSQSVERVRDAILTAVRAWMCHQDDDLSLLVLRQQRR